MRLWRLVYRFCSHYLYKHVSSPESHTFIMCQMPCRPCFMVHARRYPGVQASTLWSFDDQGDPTSSRKRHRLRVNNPVITPLL